MVPAAVLIMARDCQILHYNREAEIFFGCKREDVLGKNYLTYLPKKLQESFITSIKAVLEGKSVRGFETEMIGTDGDIYTLVWNFDPLLDSEGGQVGVIAAGMILQREV